jgi:tRNA A-37 threonylcarbamoyl transferase component Bud32
MGLDAATPSPEELRAYSEGRLAGPRFDAIDRWLGAQPPEVQERLLEAGSGSGAGALASAAGVVAAANDAPFAADDHRAQRYLLHSRIGAGGMGIVDLLKDSVLGREVVVKRCRPRRVDEAPAAYTRRVQLFKREAQLTAQLEHPGIVPVHDVGQGPHGEPSFTMKRLEGERLGDLIQRRRAGARLDLPALVEVILRVADAVGYAHSRGIVHRDLKPDNIIVGALGAVYVIDWGLAGTIGTVPAAPDTTAPGVTTAADRPGARSLSGMGMGTPAWMAPEQFGLVKADPRMDVFALGGLLMATLTGEGPRDRRVATGSAAVNLGPLDARGLPRGLVAVARRCLAEDPAGRYADASQVADDLRQWLAAGLTEAEAPGRFARLRALLRRSRTLRVGLISAAAVLAVLLLAETWRAHVLRAQALAELKEINDATASTTDPEALHDASLRLGELVKRMPDLAEARDALNRLAGARDAVGRVNHAHGLAMDVQRLIDDFMVRGPWPSEIGDCERVLHSCGLRLTADSLVADGRVLAAAGMNADGPRRDDLLEILAQLQRTYAAFGVDAPQKQVIPRLIAAAAPNHAWGAIADLVADPHIVDHDLALPSNEAAIIAAATDDRTTDLMLSLFGPQPRLEDIARARLRNEDGAFWPNVFVARVELNAAHAAEEHPGDDAEHQVRIHYAGVIRHATLALGRKQSVWPDMLLAYAELKDGDGGPGQIVDYGTILALARDGLLHNDDHLELQILRTIGMCGLGLRKEAQDTLDGFGAPGVLRWHILHPQGHPIERALRVLLEYRLVIPPGDPVPGPLVVPR